MTIDASAPAIITQMGTQLTACAAWTGTNWYPDVDLATATLPIARIDEIDSTQESVGTLAATWSGTLEVVIYSTATVPVVESLGRTLKAQLLAQSPGIPFRSITVGMNSNMRVARELTSGIK